MSDKDLFGTLAEQTERKRQEFIRTEFDQMKQRDDAMVNQFQEQEEVQSLRRKLTPGKSILFESEMTELKMTLYSEKLGTYHKKEQKIEEATKTAAQRFMEEKKVGAWNEFMNMSVERKFSQNIEEDQVQKQRAQEYYSRLEASQGEEGGLQKKVNQYLAEKKAIQNKWISSKKKEEQQKKLQEKTMGSIAGYDRFLCDMAFLKEEDFSGQMKRSGFNPEQGFLATDIEKAQRIMSCKTAYYSATVEIEKELKENKGKNQSKDDYFLEQLDLKGVLQTQDSAKETKEALFKIKDVISQLQIPGERSDPIYNGAVMGDFLRTVEQAKALQAALRNLQQQDRRGYKAAELQEQEEKLERILKSEKFFKKKLSLTDAYAKEGGINEEDRVAVITEWARTGILDKMAEAHRYKEENKQLLKTDPKKYYINAYMNNAMKKSMEADYNETVERNIRVFAVAAQEKGCMKRLTGTEFAGKTIREEFFRAAEGTYRNFKGFDGMSEERLVEMHQKLGAGYEAPRSRGAIQQNTEGLLMFRDALTSHYDYVARKYGPGLPDMPLDQLLPVFPELMRDLDTTQVNVTIIEDLESVINSDNSPDFQSLREQILYYNDVIGILHVRVTGYLMDMAKSDDQYKKFPNYAEIKNMEKKIFDDKKYSQKQGMNFKAKVRTAEEINAQNK